MRRRDFVQGLAVSAAWSLAARAQQTSKPMRRIGYLAFRAPLAADDAFLERLGSLGWIEGQNIFVDRRFAAGDMELLTKSAAELVHLNVDVIVAVASAAAKTAKDATSAIPIVFAATGDPVGQGFVASLAHPGGNITGTSFDPGPEITTKQLQLVAEIVPSVSRVAVLWNPTVPFIRTYWQAARDVAAPLGVHLISEEVSDPKEFEAAFADMDQQHVDALFVLSDTFMTFHRKLLAELALKHRLPGLYGHDQYTSAGGLMSYGPSLPELYRGAATYVDKILRGRKPADLPVQQPVKFDLIVNLKAAKALGLTIPSKVLTMADEVIE
jgi:putative ABC transport system substrate-binding protein